jgi:hypothetical protein
LFAVTGLRRHSCRAIRCANAAVQTLAANSSDCFKQSGSISSIAESSLGSEKESRGEEVKGLVGLSQLTLDSGSLPVRPARRGGRKPSEELTDSCLLC